MPGTSFLEYAQDIKSLLDALLVIGEAVQVNVQIDQRSALRGFISGLLLLSDGSELHFREFVDTNLLEPRLMYAYHWVVSGVLSVLNASSHRGFLLSVVICYCGKSTTDVGNTR